MERPVIICTEHRGVFYGKTDKDTQDILDSRTVNLKDAKMAIRFEAGKGVMDLAHSGPSGLVSSPADIGLNAVTAVFEVTKAAAKKWGGS